ncbi:Hsp70 family protein [Dactylosporangium sp. McL0621]|uniref:Hsp70 family protein n=1 Tax=Dactylosporangium sp. McL0621 TaxID=3415678 RepID=UPI003CECA938
MSRDGAVRLGIEFAADHARAALAWADGTAMVLPLDGGGQLAAPLPDDSSALADQGGPALAGGRSAVPPRPSLDWAATAFTRIVQDARDVASASVEAVVVAVPATWSHRQRGQVRAAAARAGLHDVECIPSPVAVCWHVVAGGYELPTGALVVVCEAGDGCSAAVVGRDGGGDFVVLSDVDETTVRSGMAGTASPGPVVEEVVRRAMAGAELPPGAADLVCAVGPGARQLEVGRSLQTVTGVEPMRAVEAELAVVLGTVQGPGPDGTAAVGQAAGTWGDVWAMVLPGVWSVVLFAQFLTGSRRYGPQEKVGQPGMLLASWGGLALAGMFAMLAVVGGALVAAAVRHSPDGGDTHDVPLGEWVRHRLTAVAMAGGVGAGLLAAGLYVLVGAGFFDLEAGPLVRWAVLPVLPVGAAVLVVAVAVWRRPEPPEGEWPQWLRFPPVSVLLAGAGVLLIAFDETGSPWLLQPLSWQLEQWLPPGQLTIIGPVGRLGGLCVGVAAAWLLTTRPVRRLLLGTFLALLVAAVLSWRVTGAVAIGFCCIAAAWWFLRAVRLVLGPRLLTPPSDWHAPAAAASTPSDAP